MKEKKVVLYNKKEREKKVFSIKMQLIQIDMYQILNDEIKQKIDEYIETGNEYIAEYDLPQYSRKMIINLVNDKNRESYIKLVFKKYTIEDNEKLNQLNKIQEQTFMSDMYKLNNNGR